MMTALEIILITYVCIGQILNMVILDSGSQNNRKIKIILFCIFNPFGIMTFFIIDYIQNQRNKRNGCKKEKEHETN